MICRVNIIALLCLFLNKDYEKNLDFHLVKLGT